MRFTVSEAQHEVTAFLRAEVPWCPEEPVRPREAPARLTASVAEAAAAAALGRPWPTGSGAAMSLVLLAEATGGALLDAPVPSLALGTALAGAGAADGAGEAAVGAVEGDGTPPGCVVVRAGDDGLRASGRIPVVERSAATSTVVTDAVLHPAGPRALVAFDIAAVGVSATELRPLDVTRRAVSLRLDGVPALLLCDGPEAEARRAVALRLARLAAAAEMVGVAEAAAEHALAYARGRRQFGREIGSFQAVAHRCVDNLRDVELCRSLAYGVAGSWWDGVPADAAQAKVLADDRLPGVARRAIQVLGAEGLRWDRGLHLLLRRALTLRARYPLRTERP